MVILSAFNQFYESLFVPENGIVTTNWGDSTTTRDFYDGNLPGTFQITMHLSGAQLTTLLAEYDASLGELNQFTWQQDLQQYYVFWGAPPAYRQIILDLYRVDIALVKVLATVQTFTPVFQNFFNSLNHTYVTNTGTLTTVGGVTTIDIEIEVDVADSSLDALLVRGIPTAPTATTPLTFTEFSGFLPSVALPVEAEISSGLVEFSIEDDDLDTLTNAEVQNGCRMVVTGTYP